MKKILSFGHIPTWAGGKQEQGLANVIYQLAYYMAKTGKVDMTLAAFDVNIISQYRDKLKLLGWSNRSIIIHSLTNITILIKWIIHILISYKTYGYQIKHVPGFVVKGMFLHASLQKVKPEILHLHGVQSLLFFSLIPRDVTIVITIHGMTGQDKKIKNSAKYAELERIVCHHDRITKLFFITHQLVKDFTLHYNGIEPHVQVILNAYDNNAFNYVEPKDHDCLTIATIASVCERKGQIRVLQALKSASLPVKYICIGGGEKGDIENLKQNAVQNNINFEYLGKKKPYEIREILSCVDFMILPSSSEGFGLVFLEALACGVPVILPKNLPIVDEDNIIVPNINALLLNDCSSNSINDIINQIQFSKFDKKVIADSVLNYTWDKIALEYTNAFLKL